MTAVMKTYANLQLSTLIYFVCSVCSQPTAFLQTEWQIRETLFGNNYQVQSRPDTLVTVTTSLHLLTVNHLDIKDQQLSIIGYFHLAWNDVRLDWSGNATLSTVRFIFTTEKDIWTPPVIVENAVDGLDVISTPNIPSRIVRVGTVAWMPAGIFTTSCESSVTYWPLDTQKCDIILTSWGYTSGEVLLKFDNSLDNAIVTSFYQEHGEWELLEKSHSSSVVQRNREAFSRLTFTLTLRRRPLFHMLNTLFPVILMAFLTVAIFKLTPESGERVGLSLTILLAYAVYLGLISEYIPQTSLSASILSTYLACILLLQTFAVFLTVLYLDIYLTPEDKPIPPWLLSITSSCLTVNCCRKKRKVEPAKSHIVNSEFDIALPVKADWDVQDMATGEIADNIEDDDINDKDQCKNNEYSWKQIALSLDKITMYIYFIMVTGITLTFASVMAHHYFRSY